MRSSLAFTAVLLASLASPALALAAGELTYSMSGTDGFTVLKVQDVGNGATAGSLNMGGGAYDVQTFVSGTRLYMDVGNQRDWMEMVQDKKTTLYRGPLWVFDASDIKAYDNGKGYDISGNIVKIAFRANMDSKKGAAQIDWGNYTLSLERFPGEKGGCKGDFYVNSESVAKIRCHSSGTLEDILFKDPNAFIAYIVHLNLIPDDNGGGGSR